MAYREWAPEKMATQRGVSSLSEEQYEILEDLCMLRHDVHNTDADRFYNGANGDYSELVCEELNENGLGVMCEFIGDIPDENWPSDNDWHYEKETWERKAEIENNNNANSNMKVDGYDLFKEECIRKIEESLEKWNTRVKDGLYLFDQAYGTEYCPHGHYVDTTIIENPFGEPLEIVKENDLNKEGKKMITRELNDIRNTMIKDNWINHSWNAIYSNDTALIKAFDGAGFDVKNSGEKDTRKLADKLRDNNELDEVREDYMPIYDSIYPIEQRFSITDDKLLSIHEKVFSDVVVIEDPNSNKYLAITNYDKDMSEEIDFAHSVISGSISKSKEFESYNNKLIDLTKVAKEKEKNKEQSQGMEF